MSWEYRIEEMRLTERWGAKRQAAEFAQFCQTFNDIGDEGWELVSYQAVPMTGGINTEKINGYSYLAIFKRPKPVQHVP